MLGKVSTLLFYPIVLSTLNSIFEDQEIIYIYINISTTFQLPLAQLFRTLEINEIIELVGRESQVS